MWKWVAAVLALCLTGCTPLEQSTPPQMSPTPTATPIPDSELPQQLPITGELLDGQNLARVVSGLHEAAAYLPVLKLDVTETSATMEVLAPEDRVDALRWLDGEIARVDSDVQYLGQATFKPADYPLHQVRRMFDVADLRGVRGDLVLQIVEYRPGQVQATVTSRPASSTVFFRRDGSAIAQLGVTSVTDIADGIAEVIADDTKVYAVGFNPTRGYWADVVDDEEGVVLNRTRLDGLPVFETRRNESLALRVFDPHTIDAGALAKSIARSQDDPAQECDVTIDLSLERSAPVARIDCGGKLAYADLEGRDMTGLVG